MTTWRSFVDADELFDILIRQFCIPPPDNLTHEELAKWKQLKQHVIQTRYGLLLLPSTF
jgi:son of sevenless-like protein